MEQTRGLKRMAAETPVAIALIDQLVAQNIEHVRRSGIVRCDLDELKALREGAKARLSAMASPAYDEAIASDRALAENIRAAKGSIDNLAAKCAVLETRLTNAREQTARLPEPRRSLAGITLSGIGLFSICFAPTIYSVFMSSIEDAPLAWLIALLIGAAIGTFLALVLLQPGAEAKASKHSRLVGFGLGIGFGILRISRADGLEVYMVAVGLTVLESIGVVALDWFAEKHRQSVSIHRISQAQTVALERAVADVNAHIHAERTRYDGLLAELKEREAEAFDVERVAELAAWAVEAAYRGAVNANQRLLEGGGGFALPQAS